MAHASSDKDRAESWIETLASAASQLRAGEALAELGTQARELLSEVRRAAAEVGIGDDARAESVGDDAKAESVGDDATASDRATEPQESVGGAANSTYGHAAIDTDALAGRLDIVTSSLEELADLLDAGLERLETVEMQLGDPDDSVDARLRAGIQSCERRLAGIEHRMQELSRANRPGHRTAGAPAPTLVLIVDDDCRWRCDLCLALEHQGLHALAAPDAATAVRMLGEYDPDAVLVRPQLDAEIVHAIETAAEGGPHRLVLAPAPLGHEMEAELRANFCDWRHVSASHGDAALAAEIRSVCSPDTATSSLAPTEQEETTVDAPVPIPTLP